MLIYRRLLPGQRFPGLRWVRTVGDRLLVLPHRGLGGPLRRQAIKLSTSPTCRQSLACCLYCWCGPSVRFFGAGAGPSASQHCSAVIGEGFPDPPRIPPSHVPRRTSYWSRRPPSARPVIPQRLCHRCALLIQARCRLSALITCSFWHLRSACPAAQLRRPSPGSSSLRWSWGAPWPGASVPGPGWPGQAARRRRFHVVRATGSMHYHIPAGRHSCLI